MLETARIEEDYEQTNDLPKNNVKELDDQTWVNVLCMFIRK